MSYIEIIEYMFLRLGLSAYIMTLIFCICYKETRSFKVIVFLTIATLVIITAFTAAALLMKIANDTMVENNLIYQ